MNNALMTYKMLLKNPAFISFQTCVANTGTAAYNMALTIHNQGLVTPNITISDVTKVGLILGQKSYMANYTNNGSNHSFLSTLSSRNLSFIHQELTRLYPSSFLVYENHATTEIPEILFAKYLLLYMSTILKQDKQTSKRDSETSHDSFRHRRRFLVSKLDDLHRRIQRQPDYFWIIDSSSFSKKYGYLVCERNYLWYF